jgi:pyruvate/2-oxoglutarate/acetoin dehydrogenase E1 component
MGNMKTLLKTLSVFTKTLSVFKTLKCFQNTKVFSLNLHIYKLDTASPSDLATAMWCLSRTGSFIFIRHLLRGVSPTPPFVGSQLHPAMIVISTHRERRAEAEADEKN